MRQTSCLFRNLKWTAAVLCLLIIMAWASSLWIDIVAILPGDHCAIGLAYGGVTIEISDFNLRLIPMSTAAGIHNWEGLGFAAPYVELNRKFENLGTFSAIVIPLWFLLLGIGVPTFWLWHRNRRGVPPGFCLHLWLRPDWQLKRNLFRMRPKEGNGQYESRSDKAHRVIPVSIVILLIIWPPEPVPRPQSCLVCESYFTLKLTRQQLV